MSDQPQSSYAKPQGQYSPVEPAPMQKKRNGVLVWMLGGCGLLAVLGVLACAYLIKNVGEQLGKSNLVKNSAALPTARRNLTAIRAGLAEYSKAHEGKYPASLDKAVDASLLSYTNADGKTEPVEYTPPTARTPEDASVAGFYVGQVSMNIGRPVQQRTYIRLLKDGSIVSEQVTRTAITPY